MFFEYPEISKYWFREKFQDINNHMKNHYRKQEQCEELIQYINNEFFTMCKQNPLVKFKSAALDKPCYEGGSKLWGEFIWYPAIVRSYKDVDDSLPNGVIQLGVQIYDLTMFKKRKVFRDSCLLSYNNLSYNTKMREAYYKCINLLPELILSYNKLIVDTNCFEDDTDNTNLFMLLKNFINGDWDK